MIILHTATKKLCKEGVVHILRNQPRGGGVSKCLRLITGGGGGGGGLLVDYVINIFILYQFSLYQLDNFC